MSLTSLLNDPNSYLSKFMRENFPNVLDIVRGIKQSMKSYPTIIPEHNDYSVVGTSIDYRIRFHLIRPDSSYLSCKSEKLTKDFPNYDKYWEILSSKPNVRGINKRFYPSGKDYYYIKTNENDKGCPILAKN